jgi:hypothetical protein
MVLKYQIGRPTEVPDRHPPPLKNDAIIISMDCDYIQGDAWQGWSFSTGPDTIGTSY